MSELTEGRIAILIDLARVHGFYDDREETGVIVRWFMPEKRQDDQEQVYVFQVYGGPCAERGAKRSMIDRHTREMGLWQWETTWIGYSDTGGYTKIEYVTQELYDRTADDLDWSYPP